MPKKSDAVALTIVGAVLTAFGALAGRTYLLIGLIFLLMGLVGLVVFKLGQPNDQVVQNDHDAKPPEHPGAYDQLINRGPLTVLQIKLQGLRSLSGDLDEHGDFADFRRNLTKR